MVLAPPFFKRGFAIFWVNLKTLVFDRFATVFSEFVCDLLPGYSVEVSTLPQLARGGCSRLCSLALPSNRLVTGR